MVELHERRLQRATAAGADYKPRVAPRLRVFQLGAHLGVAQLLPALDGETASERQPERRGGVPVVRPLRRARRQADVAFGEKIRLLIVAVSALRRRKPFGAQAAQYHLIRAFPYVDSDPLTPKTLG